MKLLTSKQKTAAIAVTCALSLGLTACGGAAEPAPAQPAAQPQSGASDKPKTAFDEEFEKVYEAAKKEGEIIIYGQPGINREELMKEFEKAYPGIKVKYTGMTNNAASAKLLAEQQQGRFLADLQIEGADGTFEDARDYIINPELREDKYWHGGFQDGYQSLVGSKYEGRYTYGVLASPTIYINNDVIPEGQIKTMDDLLDPQYKGKFLIKDFSRFGQATGALAGIVHQEGKEYFQKMLTQEPIIGSDDRQNAQWFMTGKYPIAIGIDTTQLNRMKESGVNAKIQRLRQDKATIYTPFSLAVLKNAPNPNAVKVFLNWYLSKEGQELFVAKLENYLSRRTDVAEPTSPESIPWSGIDVPNMMAYYSKEGLEYTNFVLEEGKKYNASQSAK